MARMPRSAKPLTSADLQILLTPARELQLRYDHLERPAAVVRYSRVLSELEEG